VCSSQSGIVLCSVTLHCATCSHEYEEWDIYVLQRIIDEDDSILYLGSEYAAKTLVVFKNFLISRHDTPDTPCLVTCESEKQ